MPCLSTGTRAKGDRENCGGRSPSRDSRSTKGAHPRRSGTTVFGRSGLECKNTQSEAPEQTNTSSLQWKVLIPVCGYRHFMPTSTGALRAQALCGPGLNCGESPPAWELRAPSSCVTIMYSSRLGKSGNREGQRSVLVLTSAAKRNLCRIVLHVVQHKVREALSGLAGSIESSHLPHSVPTIPIQYRKASYHPYLALQHGVPFKIHPSRPGELFLGVSAVCVLLDRTVPNRVSGNSNTVPV